MPNGRFLTEDESFDVCFSLEQAKGSKEEGFQKMKGQAYFFLTTWQITDLHENTKNNFTPKYFRIPEIDKKDTEILIPMEIPRNFKIPNFEVIKEE